MARVGLHGFIENAQRFVDSIPVFVMLFDAIENTLNGQIDDSNITAKSLTNASIKNGTITTALFAAGAVDEAALGAQAVTAAKIKVFASTEQTGTGAEQSIAHGLGATPGLVWVTITEAAAAFDSGEGTHDATNLKVTVTSGVKYRIFAIK